MHSKTLRHGVRSIVHQTFRASSWLGAAALTAGAVQAQQTVGSTEASEAAREPIDTIEIFGERLEQGLGTRYTAPLLETPQTITLVPREIIDQQNLLTMRDILSTLPGITFTAGEGGGGYGDGVNLRGYTATNDISTDGVRDSAQYSRTDPFNLEQLELVSGANSVYTGAGSVGGSINLVTKTPRGMTDTILDVAGGPDSYARATLDSEWAGDLADVRLNLMSHRNDVPGRDVERYARWGVAPSVAFGGDATRVTLAYFRQEDDNIPQYGVPYALGPFNDGPLPNAPTAAYYGYSNVDSQEIGVDAFTTTVDHALGEHATLRNLTRWQQVDQVSIVDPPQGSWCIDSGINPWTGAVCATPGLYTPSGPRGTVRDTQNEMVVNQTDFTLELDTGRVQHTLVTGLSLSQETYHRDNGNILRSPLGALPNPALPSMSIAGPDHLYTGPLNFIVTQRADGEVDNWAAYVFDRLQLTERFEINAGLRYEHNEASSMLASIAAPYPAPPAEPVVTPGPLAENVDDLKSYRIGFVYKPSASSSIYLAHGNSETPSQASVNGTCDLVTSCRVDPEEAQTIELGAKWGFKDQLTLTAAVFRNQRSNFRVPSGDPTIPEQQLDGDSRVDGVALGAAGAIGTKWSIFANYTYLDSEVVQAVSDQLLLGGTIDILAGDPLPNTPKHSASLWTTLRVSDAFSVGYGVTYQGEYTFARANAAADLYFAPDHIVHRAMATYELNDQLALQVNIDNVTDEVYFERIRNNANNGWATPGTTRTGVVSLTWRL
jgi:catecholate siderophore receptor